MIDPPLERDVKAAEGCRLTAYRDTRGFWTIGYGRLLDQRKDWTGYTITQAQADAALAEDLEAAEDRARATDEWASLNSACRKNAVTELIFNMGLQHWLGFKMCRAAIQAGEWLTAASELLSSAWATQVGAHRAKRLAGYLRDGEYPA